MSEIATRLTSAEGGVGNAEFATSKARCRLAEIFEPGMIALLQLAPRNPLVRALILKLTGRMPGAECGTFEQLQDWIEFHCERRVIVSGPPSGRSDPANGIHINVEFTETEYGRADYKVSRSGSDQFQVGAEALSQIVRDAIAAGGGIDDVVDLIAEQVEDDAWSQCDPTLEDCDDHDYSNHDSTSTENSETTCSKSEIRAAVLAFVRERHPELAAEP